MADCDQASVPNFLAYEAITEVIDLRRSGRAATKLPGSLYGRMAALGRVVGGVQMRRWHKLVTTIYTTLLLAPIAWFLIAYGLMECGELDRGCATGGSMPYGPVALFLFVVVLVAHAAFLFMVWSTVSSAEDVFS
jgi:hypothetical protein